MTMLQLYYVFMVTSGLVIAGCMGRFIQLFTPPIRAWWLATSMYLLTGSLMVQGLRVAVIYGLRLGGLETTNLDRWISGVLTLGSVIAAVFFLRGYLRQREWGPGAGRHPGRSENASPD
ncbi:hypothetical protein GTQ99_00135 [Kineococcus sp. T13]|uniref:hypothetical protein n=1 Tax=Kineococcus vitellinus TaxID=2696565 RepID=UPI001411C271|nr:hypothetical protein [Kineococcus vitellinus]NAZ73838.1 hypothetical protein [Kineococcus vitellinus]